MGAASTANRAALRNRRGKREQDSHDPPWDNGCIVNEDVRPTAIRLEASTHCQLRCPSCPTTARAIDAALGKGFLRFSDFRDLVDRHPRLRTVWLSNYGEVLLNPELIQILEHAHGRGVKVKLGPVNLNRASAEVLEAIVRTGVRSLTASIDGATPETYVRYRVRGDLEAVLSNLRTLVRLKEQYSTPRPHMTWQMIVFGHNEQEIAQARRMAEAMGMDFSLKLSWDDALSPIRDRDLVAAELGSTAVTRAEVREATGEAYASEICDQLWESPQINWNGDVLGCCRNFWSTFGGNAFKDGIDAAVNSESMRYARNMLTGEAPARADIPCSTCDLYLDRLAGNRWMVPPASRKAP